MGKKLKSLIVRRSDFVASPAVSPVDTMSVLIKRLFLAYIIFIFLRLSIKNLTFVTVYYRDKSHFFKLDSDQATTITDRESP
jgi:hypothetical protein